MHGPSKIPIVAVLAVLVGYDSNPKTELEGMALWTVSMRLGLFSLKMPVCFYEMCSKLWWYGWSSGLAGLGVLDVVWNGGMSVLVSVLWSGLLLVTG